VNRRPDAAAYDANQCGAFGGYGGQQMYQQKMVPNTPMVCKVHNPDWTTTTTAADESADDANKYVCGGPNGGAKPAMDSRPLPSLPRRQGNDGSGVGVTGSLISNASGSDASLHWGDTPPRPNAAATRDDAALFNQQTSSGFQQQQQHMTQQPAWQSLGGASDPRQFSGVAPEQENDYLTPRTISSVGQTAASAMQNSAGPHAMALQQPLPPSVADQNGVHQWYPQQQLPPQQQQQQQLWRQHPRLLARVSFPAVAVTDDPAMQCGIVDPSQTMPRTTHAPPGGAIIQSNGEVASGRPGGRLQ
jgi:hypothetical protein